MCVVCCVVRCASQACPPPRSVRGVLPLHVCNLVLSGCVWWCASQPGLGCAPDKRQLNLNEARSRAWRASLRESTKCGSLGQCPVSQGNGSVANNSKSNQKAKMSESVASTKRKQEWTTPASIRVPPACKAGALPFELDAHC